MRERRHTSLQFALKWPLDVDGYNAFGLIIHDVQLVPFRPCASLTAAPERALRSICLSIHLCGEFVSLKSLPLALLRIRENITLVRIPDFVARV